MSNALRLQAERSPGMPVAGWTDRATVARAFVPYWNSYCRFLRWGEEKPSAVIAWVDSQFVHEDADAKSLLVDVFMELMWDRREMAPQPEGS